MIYTSEIYRSLAQIYILNMNYTVRRIMALGETWTASKKLYTKQRNKSLDLDHIEGKYANKNRTYLSCLTPLYMSFFIRNWST